MSLPNVQGQGSKVKVTAWCTQQ